MFDIRFPSTLGSFKRLHSFLSSSLVSFVMALVFMQTGGDEGLMPYFIPTGSIFENSKFDMFAVNDIEVLKEHLMGMSKEKLTETLSKLKLKPNRKSMTKLDLTTLIVEKMTFLTQRATDITASSSSTTTLTQQEDKEHKTTPEMTRSITMTSVLMDRFGRIENVNDKSFNEFLENGASHEPEPEEEDAVSWTQEKEHVLVLLNNMCLNGLNVNSDERIMLMEKKQKFMEQQCKASQETIPNAETMPNEDEMTEDYIVSLLDFCDVSEEDFDRVFLDDKSDFYENEISVKVFSCKGGRELFKLMVEINITTCADLKNEVVRKIEHIANKTGGNRITTNDFDLSSGIVKINDNEVFDGSVSEVYVALKLHGGGVHQPFTSRKMTTKSEAKMDKMTSYKGYAEKCHGALNDGKLAFIPEFASAKAKITSFAKDVEVSAETAINNVIEKMSLEQVEKACNALSSHAGGTSEYKIGKSTSFFLGLEAFEDVSANIDNMNQLGSFLLAYAIEKMKSDDNKRSLVYVKSLHVSQNGSTECFCTGYQV